VGGHGSPSWSPDGHRVLFVTQDLNYAKICSVEVATGNLTEVLTRSRAAYCPVYSADGRHVWFTGYAKNNFALWKLPVSPETGKASGEPEVVRNTEPRLYKYLAMSRKGDKLAFRSLTMSDNLWSLPVSAQSSEPAGPPTALTNDTSAELAEYFDLKLSNAVGGTLSTEPGRATIGANDAPAVATPLISVSDPTADESQGSIDFVVSLSAPSAQNVSVSYTTAGVNATGAGYDFENTSGTLTFVAGETTKVVKVPLSAYTGLEATEFLQLNLTGAVNASIVKTYGLGTIIDNDAPAGVPVIRVADQVVDESAGTVSFVVTLDRPSTGTVKVNVATAAGSATAGTDFTTLATQTLTFLAGETTKTVTVPLTNYTTPEPTEYLQHQKSDA
jgi:hypothetical protein